MVLYLEGLVLLCLLVLGGVKAQLDTQTPIGNFQGNSSNTCHDAVRSSSERSKNEQSILT